MEISSPSNPPAASDNCIRPIASLKPLLAAVTWQRAWEPFHRHVAGESNSRKLFQRYVVGGNPIELFQRYVELKSNRLGLSAKRCCQGLLQWETVSNI